MISEKREWYQNKVISLVKEYLNPTVLDEMVKVINNKDMMDVRYARGGADLHRGIYNRFLLYEICLKNSGRGKLLKCDSEKKDYTYYFEEDNLRLIEFTPEIGSKTTELILQKDGKEIGVELLRSIVRRNMRGRGAIAITETSFCDGKVEENFRIECTMDVAKFIAKHENAFAEDHFLKEDGIEIIHEHYSYSEGRICAGIRNFVSFSRFPSYESIKFMCDVGKYEFEYSEDGSYKAGFYCAGNERYPYNRIKPYIKEILSGKKSERKKINLKEAVCKILNEKINNINEKDLYAISIFIDDDDGVVTDFSINYNCEKDCLNAGKYDEERWNYACWTGSEESLIDIIYATGEECRKIKLKNIVTKFAKELQEQGVLKERFKKDIPIIIHDYEYSKVYLKATKECNVNGEAEDFFKWYNEEMQ